MRELSKSIGRRLADSNFIRRYFVGNGVDVGGGPDPLALYAEFFPLMLSCRTWDIEDGDAQLMQGVPDGAFDFLTSSHCLEHLHDPVEGLANWFRVVRPGGYLVIVVPDEDLFEQGQFPSTFNRDHKHTFTIHKDVSWSERSHNVLDLCRGLGPAARLEKVQLLTASYRFDLPRLDQTLTPVGEAGIEFVIRKASDREASTGVPDRAVSQPPPQLRRYYNQYRRDHENLKRLNVTDPPFQDESDL